MKNKYIILIFLIFFAVTEYSFSYKFNVESSQIHNLFNIKIANVEKDKEAHAVMLQMLKKLIDSELCRANPGFEKEHGEWLVTLYDSMRDFIKKYPRAQSSLTAKLLISTVAERLWEHWSLCEKNKRSLFLNERNNILKEIKLNHPNTWQGKYSEYSLMKDFYFINRYLISDQNKLYKHLQQTIIEFEKKSNLASEIDQMSDKEIIAFNFIRGKSDYKAPFASIYHYDLSRLYKKSGQYLKASSQYKILIEKFSNTDDARWAREGIKNLKLKINGQ